MNYAVTARYHTAGAINPHDESRGGMSAADALKDHDEHEKRGALNVTIVDSSGHAVDPDMMRKSLEPKPAQPAPPKPAAPPTIKAGDKEEPKKP